MSKQNNKISFQQFFDAFPEVELPVTLSADSHHIFSENNPPLAAALIEQYLVPIEKKNIDEFTEFVACFRLPKTHAFHGVVYWKAGLMNYEYILATFDKHGELIHKEVIAGTKTEGESLIRSVATIEEDWMIYMVRGESTTDQQTYDASSSQHLNLELLPDGKVIVV